MSERDNRLEETSIFILSDRKKKWNCNKLKPVEVGDQEPAHYPGSAANGDSTAPRDWFVI